MLKILAARQAWSDRIDILVCEKEPDYFAVVKLFEITVVEKNSPVEPTASMEITAAQELMDSLWQCGLRPSEGTGSAGSLAATERHLKDMQTIVFKTLDNILK